MASIICTSAKVQIFYLLQLKQVAKFVEN